MDLLALVLSALMTLLLFLYSNLKFRNLKANSSSGAWPILGHLPLFGKGKAPPFRTLAAMADRLGPVFVVHLRMKPIVVVNNWEVTKECLTVKDKQLASRPAYAQGKYIGNDFAVFGIAPLGPYWREMRKIAMAELLSPTKVVQLRHIRLSELDEFIKELYQSSQLNNKIVLSEWFSLLVMNTITRLMSRKRYAYRGAEGEEARRFRRTVNEVMLAAGEFVLSDAFPLSFIEWLDPQGHIQLMKRVTKDVDQVIGGWITEHRENKKADADQDFIDALLSLGDEGKLKSDQYDVDTMIKGTIKSVFFGGNDSTSLTLTWMTSLLLNHRHVMSRAKEEIDQVVGRDRWVEDSDVKGLVYLQAVVKETLRLYPPGPLSTPHAAVEDCCVEGHQMKKGDELLFNIWKVHRDPRVWKSPEEFIPERFLEDKRYDFGVTKGEEFWYIPFGAGRRSCPGSEVAFHILHLTAARLLQGFDLSTPMDEPVDMVEGHGLSLSKAVPLEVVLTPSLSSKLYQQL